MSSEMETVERRLKDFVPQLWTEHGILKKLLYKNKNQHRRSPYFQYCLKVGRDLGLLKLANVEEVFASCFLAINGKKPRQKLQVLESLKRKTSDNHKYNCLERLLGVARLLSEMVNPLLQAASQMCTLFAQSFFMKFSVTMLAILGRIRVLIQQILVDAVAVYNALSSLSQMQHAVKFSQACIEVTREYFPRNEATLELQCEWQTDKFVLVEKLHENDVDLQSKDEQDGTSLKKPKIQYQSIGTLLGGDDLGFDVPLPSEDDEDTQVEDDTEAGANNKDDTEAGSCSNTETLVKTSTSMDAKKEAKKKVAFMAVKLPTTPTGNES